MNKEGKYKSMINQKTFNDKCNKYSTDKKRKI